MQDTKYGRRNFYGLPPDILGHIVQLQKTTSKYPGYLWCISALVKPTTRVLKGGGTCTILTVRFIMNKFLYKLISLKLDHENNEDVH